MFRRLSGMLLGLLCACSPVDVLNALAPIEGFRVTSDVAYRPGPRSEGRDRLDIYAPEQTNAPVVVFLYGGGCGPVRRNRIVSWRPNSLVWGS